LSRAAEGGISRVFSLLKNRVFWIGAFVPVAVMGGLLAYGASHGAHASGPESDASPPLVSVPTVPAASSMSGLNSTQTVALPSQFRNDAADIAAGSGAPSSQTVGTIDTSQAHLLLNDVGSSGASVYAVATSQSDVCIFVTSGNATCGSQFNDRAPVVWVGSHSAATGAVSEIAGMAPDRVRSIALDEGSTSQRATLSNNAFYVEPNAYPVAIVITYDDGTTQTLTLPSQQQLKH
jgi:hypothetical protein